jgi:predicted deacylase
MVDRIHGYFDEYWPEHLDKTHLTRVTVDQGGLFVPSVAPGAAVSAGDYLGTFSSPRDFSRVGVVTSPNDAVVLTVVENPVLGKRGEAYA